MVPARWRSGARGCSTAWARALCLAVTMLIVTVAMPSQAWGADRGGDPLRPLLTCIEQGPFRALDRDRLPEQVTSRQVRLPDGERRVSLLDGYRVILVTPQGEPFVNLKVERSIRELAEADRAVVLDQMRAFAERKPAGSAPMRDERRGRVRLLGLDQPSLAATGPLGLYMLLVEDADLIVTAYVLNQTPARRAFDSLEGYEALRELAMRHILGCLG